MPKTEQHWTDSLDDSVYALYEAAEEYRLAHRAAQIALQSVDIDRRQIHPGRIALDGRTTAWGNTLTRDPHGCALVDIGDAYRDVEQEMGKQFEQAALLYASGAAWAVEQVQSGTTPAVVTFQADETGSAIPNSLPRIELVRYAEQPALNTAYAELMRCVGAAEYAESLAGVDEISDQDVNEMFRAEGIAKGTAEAAYAYGRHVQSVLHYVLIEPRRARERELIAAGRAAIPQQPTASN